jgi:hypothetical protein
MRNQSTAGGRLIAAGLIVLGMVIAAGPACALETELAGLKLFRGYKTVLDRYGDPAYVEVGITTTRVFLTTPEDWLQLFASGSGGAAGSPREGAPAAGGGTAYTEPEITWYYSKGDVLILCTIAADKNIAEIGMYARTAEAQRTSSFRTSRGIRLGSSYKDVIAKYGWPNEHQPLGGGLMLLRYTETNNVVFMLDEQYKVVAIVIATNEAYYRGLGVAVGGM